MHILPSLYRRTERSVPELRRGTGSAAATRVTADHPPKPPDCVLAPPQEWLACMAHAMRYRGHHEYDRGASPRSSGRGSRGAEGPSRGKGAVAVGIPTGLADSRGSAAADRSRDDNY